MREIITLVCQECKNRNYTTTKSRERRENKITLRKFCKFCHQHTSHKETK
ncbi:MAG TPA: 50S ribosomal protein L33 [Candidatus Omnitrophica bacterium]|nr:50S ribosomal protein L33 [Candidatus Omnitrophota bacterium]